MRWRENQSEVPGWAPAGGAPAEWVPAEWVPAEGTPAEGLPAEGLPAEGTSAEGVLAEGTADEGGMTGNWLTKSDQQNIFDKKKSCAPRSVLRTKPAEGER